MLPETLKGGEAFPGNRLQGKEEMWGWGRGDGLVWDVSYRPFRASTRERFPWGSWGREESAGTQ